MQHWIERLLTQLQHEAVLIRVVVAQTRGSTPRESGADMLVGETHTQGTIGGGQLELRSIEIARHMLLKGAPCARTARFPLGQKLGQCCGGSVVVWFERYEQSDELLLAQGLKLFQSGQPCLKTSILQSQNHLEHRFHERENLPRLPPSLSPALHSAVLTSISQNPTSLPALAQWWRSEDEEILIERLDTPKQPLWIFGAGHVGKALIGILSELPFQITWIDSRRDQCVDNELCNVKLQWASDPDQQVCQAPPGTFFIVMTHSHELDFKICHQILLQPDFGWAGLIGSETKAACFNLRLAREEVPADTINRLTCPIGVSGIDSKIPEVIAVSVAAQLLQIEQSQSFIKTCTPPISIAHANPSFLPT